jgi:hypothetical protein
MLIALSTILLAQEVTKGSKADGFQQLRVIPFNVTAGVLGGGASVGVFRGGAIFAAPPEPLGNLPALFLPPHADSFATQNIIVPAELDPDGYITVEVFFSASEKGAVNLLVETITSTVAGPRLGITQERVVSNDGGLKREVFSGGSTAGGDVLTVSIGRRAKDNFQDTNPGVVRIEAVKISYVPR